MKKAIHAGTRAGKALQTNVLAAVVTLMLVVAGMVLPVLLDGRAGILDTPVIAYVCRTVQWDKPLLISDIMGFGNQSRPLQVVAFLPALVWQHAHLYHLFQNVLLLLITSIMIVLIIRAFGGKHWMAVAGTIAALVTPSFTPNYFTLWTMEPYMLFGVMGLVWVWVRLLGAERVGRGAWWGYNGLGVVFAAYAIGVKEVGVMAFAVCMAAAVIIAWQNRVGVIEGVRRALPSVLAAALACAAVLLKYLTIQKAYDAGGRGGYVLAADALQRSLVTFIDYFSMCAPHTFLAAPAWVVLMWYTWRAEKAGAAGTTARRAVWGAAVFYVIALGMAAIYLPWQVFDARYLLLANCSFVLAAWLVAQALYAVGRAAQSVVARVVLKGYAVLLGVLVLAHAGYTVIVGPLSEGRARHGLATAYDEMFKYVVRETPTNGVVYFLMDWVYPEARQNSVHSLDVFYERPDIVVRFPTNGAALRQPGLVVVSEYEMPVYYSRMVVHHDAREVFYRQMQPWLHLREVTNMMWRTPVRYVQQGYNSIQYLSVWGVPAFWKLKRGEYANGWRIFRYEGRQAGAAAGATVEKPGNLLGNGGFVEELAGWRYWPNAAASNAVSVVQMREPGDVDCAVRIQNAGGALVGVQQAVRIFSGEVYRLSAAVRSLQTTDSDTLFGARVALFLPPQPEQQLVWMSEYNNWWPKSLVFTNQVTGTAVVYAHLGYGKIATTGEFSAIRLERVGRQ